MRSITVRRLIFGRCEGQGWRVLGARRCKGGWWCGETVSQSISIVSRAMCLAL